MAEKKWDEAKAPTTRRPGEEKVPTSDWKTSNPHAHNPSQQSGGGTSDSMPRRDDRDRGRR